MSIFSIWQNASVDKLFESSPHSFSILLEAPGSLALVKTLVLGGNLPVLGLVRNTGIYIRSELHFEV